MHFKYYLFTFGVYWCLVADPGNSYCLLFAVIEAGEAEVDAKTRKITNIKWIK